jgi:hypothetical protein
MRMVRWAGTLPEIQEVPARVCCWCPRAHYLTPEDRIRHAAGAKVSHGLCEKASEAMLADLESHGNGEAE